MQTDELKRLLQSHFSDGLVTVVGSGLSCAEGLPGMGAMADHLLREIPPKVVTADADQWHELEKLIPDVGLEPALFKVDLSDGLQALIASLAADYVADAEVQVLSEVFSGQRQLRLTGLVPHMLKPSGGIPVVTTNYDTLVEVAFEEAGLGVDTMFVGQFAGSLDERESRMSLLRDVKLVPAKGVRYRYRDHAVVLKPHGSLDWYHRDGKPVRCSMRLPGGDRLIIAPGKHKFRSGYDSPFDRQRERANEAIDKAARFLIIGYGFNDDHLETHLGPAIRSGKPALLLTRSLTANAERLATENLSVIALERRDEDHRSRLIFQRESHTIEENLWDLGSFVKGVFGT